QRFWPAWLECPPATHRQTPCSLSVHPSFQMAERQFQLGPDAESTHFSTRSSPPLPPRQPDMQARTRCLDCAAPILFLARTLRCGARESVRALTNARGLRPAQERKGIAALDLSRGI